MKKRNPDAPTIAFVPKSQRRKFEPPPLPPVQHVNKPVARREPISVEDEPEEAESTLSKYQLLDSNLRTPSDKRDIQEIQQIKDHYLGTNREKKKIQKPSEKFRNIFNFEWDASEDSSLGDSNPLYQHRVEPQLLFGRGFRAGIDIREQRKANSFYDDLAKKRVEIGEDDLGMAPKAKKDEDKSIHWSEKPLELMTERDWRILREDFSIYIKGGKVPRPVRKWEESDLPQALLKAIKKAEYTKPTPIQMQAIPIASEMRDLIGIAVTGSGKTAAFVLPMLKYALSLPPLNESTLQDGPYGLILAPARELALQIEEETKKFCEFIKVRVCSVVGGRNAEAQGFLLREGVEIVVGTPGRVKEVLEKAFTVLSQCSYIVLDEADRMIDLGFEEVVNWILDQIPSTNLKSTDEDEALKQELEAKAGYRRYRITHMFSATMPIAVERLARKYLRGPAYISVGDPGAGKRSIEQRCEFITEGRKRQRLLEVLESGEAPIMIFMNQKKMTDVLARELTRSGHSAVSLHGGKNQDMREQSLTYFKDGSVDVLIATDVVGRGIDVEGVQLVINYDMPKDIETYTHRIGRTGRAGLTGKAVSFVTDADAHLFYDLKSFLRSSNQPVPMELAQHPASKNKPGSETTHGKITK